jgi:hypothetical protein
LFEYSKLRYIKRKKNQHKLKEINNSNHMDHISSLWDVFSLWLELSVCFLILVLNVTVLDIQRCCFSFPLISFVHLYGIALTDKWYILALKYTLQTDMWSILALKLHILSILALKYIPKYRSKNISPNCTDDKQFSSVIYNQNKTKTKQYVEGVTRPIKTVKISPNFYYVYLKHGIPIIYLL